MKFHYIAQGYFGDREYRMLSRDEGYFFSFLWQLPQLSAAGIGRVNLGIMAAESYGKFTLDECRTLLAALQARHRVVYDAEREWLWIVNYYKFKPGGNGWALINARQSIAECESTLIVDGWLKKYGNLERVRTAFGTLQRACEDMVAQGRGTADDQAVLDGIEAEPAELHIHRAEVEAVWIHYCKKMKSQGFLTPLRRLKILERLRENILEDEGPRTVKVEDLLQAITNATKSDFHMGRDPRTQGHKYNALEQHILGNQEKFLYWLAYRGGPAALPSGRAQMDAKLGRETVYRETTPTPAERYRREPVSAEEDTAIKTILKRTIKTLTEPTEPGSTERVFRG